MPTFARAFEVAAPLEVVRRFHGSTRAIPWLTPPPLIARVHRGGDVAEGMVADFTLWLGPIPLRWRAIHRDVEARSFVDEQARGPFAAWSHRHELDSIDGGRTRVHDEVEYEHRPGVPGLLTRALMGGPALHVLFAYRALATKVCCRRGWGPAG